MENRDIAHWLEVSQMLFNELRPPRAGLELFGGGMAQDDFARLADREAARVDHALVAMATADGQDEVMAVFGQLERDTVIAMFSRWARYTDDWKRNPPQWMPKNRKTWWRAVLLAMTCETAHSTSVARSLWAAELGGPKAE